MERFGLGMLVSTDYKFVFVHIPKTAGTSVTQILTSYCVTAPVTRLRRIARKLGLKQNPSKAFFRSHDTASQVLRSFGEDVFASYRIFSIIRNPFDHAVSHYTYLREFPKAKVATFFSGVSFLEYLDFRLRSTSMSRMPPFTRMKDQTSFVSDSNDQIIVPNLLHFENLANDIPRLISALKLPAMSLPHARRTKGRAGTLEKYYHSSEIEEKLRKLYARDFVNFGYPDDWRQGFAPKPQNSPLLGSNA